MERYKVYSTAEKTYVDHLQHGCIARLCRMSGEFYRVYRGDNNDGLQLELAECIQRCTWQQFVEGCRKWYELEISDEFRPGWA